MAAQLQFPSAKVAVLDDDDNLGPNIFSGYCLPPRLMAIVKPHIQHVGLETAANTFVDELWTAVTTCPVVAALPKVDQHIVLFEVGFARIIVCGQATSTYQVMGVAARGVDGALVPELQAILEPLETESDECFLARAVMELYKSKCCFQAANGDVSDAVLATANAHLKVSVALANKVTKQTLNREAVMAQAWSSSGSCFYACHKIGIAAKCFKKVGYHVTNITQHNLYTSDPSPVPGIQAGDCGRSSPCPVWYVTSHGQVCQVLDLDHFAYTHHHGTGLSERHGH
jgi:hypothetical protein